jgi:hypothetical protein
MWTYYTIPYGNCPALPGKPSGGVYLSVLIGRKNQPHGALPQTPPSALGRQGVGLKNPTPPPSWSVSGVVQASRVRLRPSPRPVSPFGRAAASGLALDPCPPPTWQTGFSNVGNPPAEGAAASREGAGFRPPPTASRCPKPRRSRGEAVAPAPVGVPAGQGVSRRRSASPATGVCIPWGPFYAPSGGLEFPRRGRCKKGMA